jgi:RNA polymerase sigma-70 factor (ECF subfamily)
MTATGDRNLVPVEPVPEPELEPEAASERATVDRARGGDREALGAIYDRYITQVYRYVLAHVGNPAEAEDLAEEVFVRVVEYIGRFHWQENVPFSAWLFRIARNHVISHHRRHAARPASVSADDFDVEDSRPGPDFQVEHALTMQEVYAACRDLPPLQRQVIALRFASGLSVKETAEALGKTENNVKVLQHKAIAKLQKRLRRE